MYTPIRWPDHWYHDQEHISCIVPNCTFVSDATSVTVQWTEIHDHCTSAPGTEHALLEILLRQTHCAIDDCGEGKGDNRDPSRVTRRLFRHEKDDHGSTKMSNLCSFVTLAREGRIRLAADSDQNFRKNEPNCERLAYERMMEKVVALPEATIQLIFQKCGFIEHTIENLGKILTHDHLAKPREEDPPYWWPIRAEHFLWACRPKASEPENSTWRAVWTDLRQQYAEGRI